MYYFKTFLRCTGIVAVMVGITLLLGRSPHDVVPGTMALAYLTIVIIVAALWQVRQGLFACATGALCFAYFLPPAHSFRVTAVRHWILLIAFIIAAITASYLSNRIQSEAEVANLRREEMERLYDFSQRLLAVGNVADLVRSIPRSLRISFQLHSAILYLADQDRIYSSENPNRADTISEAEIATMRAAMDAPIERAKSGDTFVPLRAGQRAIGLLTLAGTMPAIETLETVGGLVTMSITRATAMEDMARSEAGRENDWIRNVLLDSATRDLRLPVLAIEAAVNNLHAATALTPEERASTLALITTESARLHGLIDQAALMLELQPDDVGLQMVPGSMSDVVQAALAAKSAVLRHHPVVLDLLDRSHSVVMDGGWIVQVLGYLLDNAVCYSAPGEAITIHSESRGNKLLLSVMDRGAGIDPAEQALIFQRFYRGTVQPENCKGAGMGLAIARAIVEAHGGTLEVTSQLGRGAAFMLSLPLAAE